MYTYMITDYPHNNSVERKGDRGGTDRAVSVIWACKRWDFKSPVVWSRRIKHFCAPSQSQTKNLEMWSGGEGALIFHSVDVSIANPM